MADDSADTLFTFEGCLKDGKGSIYRCEGGLHIWTPEGWKLAENESLVWPLHRCDDPERSWKSGAELAAWLVAHPTTDVYTADGARVWYYHGEFHGQRPCYPSWNVRIEETSAYRKDGEPW